MRLQGRPLDPAEWQEGGSVFRLREATRRRLAIPTWTRSHARRHDRAQGFVVDGADGKPETAFRVTEEGELYEMAATIEADTERVAAAWRWLHEFTPIARVRFRTDDPWLLPFAMSQPNYDQARLVGRLLFLKEAAPLLWGDTRPECVELNPDGDVAALREAALEHHADGRLAVIEAMFEGEGPDFGAPTSAPGADGSAIEALRQRGFHDAVQSLVVALD